MRTALERGEEVKLSGFGNFALHEKNERPGRNPKTGEAIPISARRVVTFRPGQKLKARVEAYAGPGQPSADIGTIGSLPVSAGGPGAAPRRGRMTARWCPFFAADHTDYVKRSQTAASASPLAEAGLGECTANASGPSLPCWRVT